MDWTNPDELMEGCIHFKVKEALWLPSWSRLACETDGLTDEIKANLIKTFQWMESIRAFFGKSINVHVAYRPTAYNKLIGGALHSAHLTGEAVDFDISEMNCDDVMNQIIGSKLLEAFGLRMENNFGRNWIHLDSHPPNPNRVFNP